MNFGATKVASNDNIRSTDPVMRNCFFNDEHQLKAHLNYSQATGDQILIFKTKMSAKVSFQAACLLECRISNVLSQLNTKNKCIPWYYPNVHPDLRICSPFEAWDFNAKMEKVGPIACRVTESINFQICI